MEDMCALKNEVAVVTGATSGVGESIALGLAAQGAVLCLVGRNAEALREVSKRAGATSPRVLRYQADLLDGKAVLDLTMRIKQDVEHIDMLIHSAGEISRGRMEHAPIEELDRQYGLNVRAPYLITQSFLPLLKARQGQIVFVNSSAGLAAKGDVGQYAATKHALKAIADSLRDEVNRDGVRVLSVYLGRTATRMQKTVQEMEGTEYHPEWLIQPEDVTAIVVSALKLPRTAEVTDIQIRPMKKLN